MPKPLVLDTNFIGNAVGRINRRAMRRMRCITHDMRRNALRLLSPYGLRVTRVMRAALKFQPLSLPGDARYLSRGEANERDYKTRPKLY